MIPEFLRVRVIKIPATLEVKRTWRERWFSLPWRPRELKKTIRNPAAPEPGKILMAKDVWICDFETGLKVEQQLEAARAEWGAERGLF